jgi:hypothetical protein
LSKLRAKALVEKVPHSRRYRLTREGYSICLVFLKLFDRVYAPLTAGLLQPVAGDSRLQQKKRSQLDRLYTPTGTTSFEIIPNWNRCSAGISGEIGMSTATDEEIVAWSLAQRRSLQLWMRTSMQSLRFPGIDSKIIETGTLRTGSRNFRSGNSVLMPVAIKAIQQAPEGS